MISFILPFEDTNTIGRVYRSSGLIQTRLPTHIWFLFNTPSADEDFITREIDVAPRNGRLVNYLQPVPIVS